MAPLEALFGVYSRACADAAALLFQAGNAAAIDLAARATFHNNWPIEYDQLNHRLALHSEHVICEMDHLGMNLSGSLVMLAAFVPGQPPAADVEQDFRGSGPVHPSLSLFGPDADNVIKAEAEGLRITLPTNGRQTYGWGVARDAGLSGDFEMTAVYELLRVDRPKRGGGAGVALNLQSDDQRTKFAKVGCFVGTDGKRHFVAECWTERNAPGHFRGHRVRTDALTGKLRFERKGSLLRFLAAAAPGDGFQELLQVEFGSEDIPMVRFIANNNSSPTVVDARLLDLKLRSDNLIETQGLDMSKAWLPALLGVVLLLSLAVLGLLLWRNRRRGGAAAAAGETRPAHISFPCSACGKNLRAAAEMAGKNVRCPGCGQAVVVPATSVQ